MYTYKINALDGEYELQLDNTYLKNQKLAKIHFYAQVAGGPNAAVYEVARAAISTNAPLSFEKVLVVYATLTTGPAVTRRSWGGLMAS